MTQPRELTAYDYVIVAYDRVSELLGTDAARLFERATVAAARRAGGLIASLHVNIGPIEVAADIKFDVRSVTDKVSALGEHSTIVDLTWTAARGASFFPVMDAQLTVFPLSRTETQLDLLGHYVPPIGVVGNLIDAVVGHRIARASVLRFVQEVARQIEADLK